jgi:hypothetical protein
LTEHREPEFKHSASATQTLTYTACQPGRISISEGVSAIAASQCESDCRSDLIVAFSFSLAAVLIVIGILLVCSRSLVERLGGIGSRWSSVLPLARAGIVTALAVGITLSDLATYLG